MRLKTNNRRIAPIDCNTADFQYVIRRGIFYIDKSLLIKDILTSKESVIFFSRPRRFGKSLNLSMINHFFNIKSSKGLFEGLAIAQYKYLCEKHQNKYPVVLISFKDVEGLNFEDFLIRLNNAISYGIRDFCEDIAKSSLSKEDKDYYSRLLNKSASKEEIRESLFRLSAILESVFKQKAVLLIDEYDVPLQKASLQDYYEQALDIISGLFSAGFKSNPHLFLGIATGCLKISKETIFTGLNNISTYTLFDDKYKNAFGFTEEETKNMLYGFSMLEQFPLVKQYYDGYPGLGTTLFCPFDVVHYVSDYLANPNAKPRYYWMNTSENEIIRSLLNVSDSNIRDEVEALVSGGTIEKEIDLYLTYRDLYKNPQNIYSVLLSSGYLIAKKVEGNTVTIAIPNEEVRYIFRSQITKWIEERINKNYKDNQLIECLFSSNLEKASATISEFLWNSIGIHDYSRSNHQREGFYHGLLLGLLSKDNSAHYQIKSNVEAGLGYADIAITTSDATSGIIIECKYASNGDFETVAEEAFNQIDEKRYTGFFLKNTAIKKIAAIFYQKRCIFISK